MWYTPEGSRILKGAEAELFLAGLDWVVRMTAGDPKYETGISTFDALSQGQRLVILATVGRSLLWENTPEPLLTAALEAAIGTVYDFVGVCVEEECFEPVADLGMPTWRMMVLNAWKEREEQLKNAPDDEHRNGGNLPAPDCTVTGEWQFLIDSVRDRILWDEDWLDADEHGFDPATAEMPRGTRGCADNYMTAVPREPTGAELAEIVATLEAIVGPLEFLEK